MHIKGCRKEVKETEKERKIIERERKIFFIIICCPLKSTFACTENGVPFHVCLQMVTHSPLLELLLRPESLLGNVTVLQP